ncbi:CHAP domain-containing protein [Streptococcus jiangjianxini]|uniref:CHAP domain-containing protein n=1 Tax=Streptococcus jiangjianxini TaxID=3161189 RepID=UPI0032EF9BF7
MTTVNEVVNWAKNLANQGVGVDYDLAYGRQCADLPNWILGKFFGKSIWGNAIDLLTSAKQAGYTVINDAPGVNPKAGDLFVMRTYAHPYGHTGLVIADSDGYTLKTIEQNVDGNADALVVGGPARYVTRRFNQADGKVIGWIRPPYSNASAPKASSAPAGKLKDERATFTVNVSLLNVRDKPSVKGKIVAQYGKGMSLNYDSVYVADGYIWVSYVSRTGARRYIACGVAQGNRNVAPYGTFK